MPGDRPVAPRLRSKHSDAEDARSIAILLLETTLEECTFSVVSAHGGGFLALKAGAVTTFFRGLS